MTSRPHLAFGLFGGAVVTSCYQIWDISFTSNLLFIFLAIGASIFGALSPDLDTNSPIARMLPFISKAIQRKWPHRTACHSIIGVIFSSAIIYYVTDFLTLFIPIPDDIPFILCVFFLGGNLSHLVVDSLTKNGIKWIWPYQRAFAYPSSPKFRIKTGDKKPERNYTFFFLFLFFAYLPVIKAGGPTRSIHRAFKNFDMAQMDYLHSSNIETFLQFSGSYRHNRESISGKSLILDAKANFFIIYFDEKVLTIGDQAIILGTEFICEYTNNSPQLTEITVVNQPIDSILSNIPEDVLISGELISHKQFQATSPLYTANDFPTIKLLSNRIEFSYATKKEISLLQIKIPKDIQKLQYLVQRLGKEIESTKKEIESMITKRSIEKDLLVRHILQKKVEELKSKKKSMEKNLERSTQKLQDYGSSAIGFSGRLSLRELPPFIVNKESL